MEETPTAGLVSQAGCTCTNSQCTTLPVHGKSHGVACDSRTRSLPSSCTPYQSRTVHELGIPEWKITAELSMTQRTEISSNGSYKEQNSNLVHTEDYKSQQYIIQAETSNGLSTDKIQMGLRSLQHKAIGSHPRWCLRHPA
jgi:hypothetical protein